MYCIYEIAHIISIYCFNNRTNVQLSGPYGFLIWLSVFLCVGCFQRSGRHTGCTRTTEKTTWTQTWGHRSCNYLITYDSSLTFIVFYKCRYGIDIIATFLGGFLIIEWAGEGRDIKEGCSCWGERGHTPTSLQILRGRSQEISSP